jgi:hypothetical protein
VRLSWADDGAAITEAASVNPQRRKRWNMDHPDWMRTMGSTTHPGWRQHATSVGHPMNSGSSSSVRAERRTAAFWRA